MKNDQTGRNATGKFINDSKSKKIGQEGIIKSNFSVSH